MSEQTNIPKRNFSLSEYQAFYEFCGAVARKVMNNAANEMRKKAKNSESGMIERKTLCDKCLNLLDCFTWGIDESTEKPYKIPSPECEDAARFTMNLTQGLRLMVSSGVFKFLQDAEALFDEKFEEMKCGDEIYSSLYSAIASRMSRNRLPDCCDLQTRILKVFVRYSLAVVLGNESRSNSSLACVPHPIGGALRASLMLPKSNTSKFSSSSSVSTTIITNSSASCVNSKSASASSVSESILPTTNSSCEHTNSTSVSSNMLQIPSASSVHTNSSSLSSSSSSLHINSTATICMSSSFAISNFVTSSNIHSSLATCEKVNSYLPSPILAPSSSISSKKTTRKCLKSAIAPQILDPSVSISSNTTNSGMISVSAIPISSTRPSIPSSTVLRNISNYSSPLSLSAPSTKSPVNINNSLKSSLTITNHNSSFVTIRSPPSAASADQNDSNELVTQHKTCRRSAPSAASADQNDSNELATQQKTSRRSAPSTATADQNDSIKIAESRVAVPRLQL